MFLCARNLFVKKINRLEIIWIASFYNTTITNDYSYKIVEGKNPTTTTKRKWKGKNQRLDFKMIEGKNPTTIKKDLAEISDTTLTGLRVTTSVH